MKGEKCLWMRLCGAVGGPVGLLEASLEREVLPEKAVFDWPSGVVGSQEGVGNGFVAAESITHEGGLCCLERKWVLKGEGTGA